LIILVSVCDAESLKVENMAITSGLFKGCFYTGTVDKDGKPHGKGVLKGEESYGIKATVHGNFKHGSIYGYVNYKNTYGNSFEGTMKNNKEDGYGVSKDSSGNYYSGYWKDGKYHGWGTYTYYDKGYWMKGSISGFGIQVRQGKFTYIGEFKKGAHSGLGCIIWEDGSRYVGEWNKKSEGFSGQKMKDIGCRVRADGSIMDVGSYMNNSLDGFVAMQKESNVINFLGHTSKIERQNGVVFQRVFDKSSFYLGYMEKGKAQGVGFMDLISLKDWIHFGMFLENKAQGNGIRLYEDQEPVFGSWEQDVLKQR
jgi:hypothetical protein